VAIIVEVVVVGLKVGIMFGVVKPTKEVGVVEVFS